MAAQTPLSRVLLRTSPKAQASRSEFSDPPLRRRSAACCVCVASTVFQSVPYLAAYRRYFGAGKEFHRLHGASGGRASAFLMTRGRTLKRLEFWGAGIHDIGAIEYSDEVAARDLWHKIANLAAQYDGAHLAQVDARSPLVEFSRAAGWQVEDAEACPVLELPATYTEYVSSLGKNMREQIKRYPKRLEKQFSVEYELAQSDEQVQRALSDLFLLHGTALAAARSNRSTRVAATQQFIAPVCSAFFKRDWLRLWTLRCDGQAACVVLNYFHGGRYHFFIGGFEPELMRWSVGTCLFARVLEHAISEGAREFDFLRGEEEYKYRFGAVNRDYKTISPFADSHVANVTPRMELEASFTRKLHKRFSAVIATRNLIWLQANRDIRERTCLRQVLASARSRLWKYVNHHCF
jgi:CelD/BcsL family acetyltransferase involved in cellulose biosynthesis